MTGSFFGKHYVVNESVEVSYGTGSTGAERPEAAGVGECTPVQDLTLRCD